VWIAAAGWNAQRAQGRDQPAPGRIGQRQVVDGSGKDVRDLLRDQLLGRGHADVDRVREAADRRARLLAEGGVGLVGDHEVVRLGVQVAPVAREPRVGLDRQRVRLRWLLAALDGVDDPVAVALSGEVAVELGNEQSAVGENEHPERARGLDEAGGRDRLAGRGRMSEAEAADCAGVFFGREGQRQLVRVAVGGRRRLQLVFVLLVDLRLGVGAVSIPQLGRGLSGGDQFGEHAGERVDLVLAQLGSGGEPRRTVGEHALEPEHQRVAALPFVGRRGAARVHLLDRVVESEPAGGSGSQYDGRVFVGPEKWLSGPVLRAGGGLGETVCRLRR
jgi:hypothetical protein